MEKGKWRRRKRYKTWIEREKSEVEEVGSGRSRSFFWILFEEAPVSM